jgi:P2 family phage contractile tail tube protein
MDGAVGVDMGQENLEMELTAGGFIRQALEQYGSIKVDGVPLRFAGAYQQDDTCEMAAVEVFARGRWQEIDSGNAKPGEETEFKLKARLSYYRLAVNGQNLIEIDLLNFIFVVNGVDMLEEQRRAIGLA